jgi:parvulin-like peptidyl-prolyl isomerase
MFKKAKENKCLISVNVLRHLSGFLFLFFFMSTVTARENANYPNDTLAIIGGKIISVSDFIQSYKDRLLRLGLTDNGDTRVKYLMNLVDDEILISKAKKTGSDKTKAAQTEYKRIRMQELLNAFSSKHIEPGITITEKDIRDLYIKMNTKIKARHLYAPSKEKADSLYSELMSGKTFEELAKGVFQDPKLRDNGGELGYISFDEMDPDFEKTGYLMRIGEISKPVKTVEGYSIIKVEDIKQNPFNTENEVAKAHDRLKTLAKKRAYEEAAKQYTRSQRELLKLKFNKPLVTKLFNSIQNDTLLVIPEKTFPSLKNDLSKIVVSTRTGKWDLNSLITEMSITTPQQRKWIRTEENLEDYIAGLVIRKHTVQKTIQENLDNSPLFKKNVDFNFGTYLMNQEENKLKESIKISPDSIRIYYEENKDRFRTEPEIRLSSILVDNDRLAGSIKNSLENGARFDLLAKQFSIQLLTGENGGDMGFFRKSELGELGERTFNLKTDEWIGPVMQEGKYVFLKCTEIKELRNKTLSEVSKDIEQTLTTINWFKVRKNYTESLKKEIHVRLFPEKLNTLNIFTKID